MSNFLRENQTGIWMLVAVCSFSGCGSGSQPKAIADFSLSSSPTSVSLKAGGTAQMVTLTAAALNGFTGTIQSSVSGLPAGVTASPSTLSLTAGGSQQVSFVATAGAAASSATATISATSGDLNHTLPITITVTAASAAGIDITTYHDDIARTGLNSSETTLTPANVTSATFGLLRTLPVDGLVDGEPLYLSGLDVGGQAHNVVFAVSSRRLWLVELMLYARLNSAAQMLGVRPYRCGTSGRELQSALFSSPSCTAP